MIHISSKIHGIEVGGMRHPMQTVHYHEDQIEPEQLDAFLASEYLTVEVDEAEGLAGTGDEVAGDGIDDEGNGIDAGTEEMIAEQAVMAEAEMSMAAKPVVTNKLKK